MHSSAAPPFLCEGRSRLVPGGGADLCSTTRPKKDLRGPFSMSSTRIGHHINLTSIIGRHKAITMATSNNSTYTSEQVAQLHSLFATGKLIHPYLSWDCFNEDDNDKADCSNDNFVDLAASIAMCCGADLPSTDGISISCTNLGDSASYSEVQRRRMQLAADIGGNPTKDSQNKDIYPRKHIILILCDGMGNSILESTHASDSKPSFFIDNNQPSRIRAVFPSTTPAALTTLATAAWPGRHGKFFENIFITA
jgi:hypothetical protein